MLCCTFVPGKQICHPSSFEENEKERRKKYSLVFSFGRCCPWPQVTT